MRRTDLPNPHFSQYPLPHDNIGTIIIYNVFDSCRAACKHEADAALGPGVILKLFAALLLKMSQKPLFRKNVS